MRNECVWEVCGVKKDLNERNGSMLKWSVQIERMEGSWLAKQMYSGGCVRSQLYGRMKKWIESVEKCFMEKNEFGKARKSCLIVVNDGVCEGYILVGLTQGRNPTMKRYHSEGQ